jgi:hypothetical protein
LKKFEEFFNIGIVDDLEHFGEPMKTNYGGHSCRRSGCQLWYRRHLPEALIRRLARWRSEIIERYLGAAPVAGLGPHSFTQALVETAFLKQVDAGAVLADRLFEEVHQRLQQAFAGRPKTVTQQLGLPELKVITCFPGKPRRVHKIAILLGPPEAWQCICGYKYGKTSHFVVEQFPDDKISSDLEPCKRGCFKKQPR